MSSSGIQTLLKAEKEAQEIVSAARSYRAQRLKSAKSDATQEIEAYKLQKDQELKDFEAKYDGINANADTEAANTVKEEVEKLKKTAESKQKDVVALLVDAITHPTPEVHINAQV
ncbi:H(+)-transporting V1 sector ATPase subunit G [Saccharomycopsis crataegensis]|uniref:V-type proton ATPase subunit G n=1 Tax=Saccharomycopsis crataegensis TaxID=43959 RepID=A0AAV5QJ88_9ASCO|nr:H(+)-transporting V1 sector ATPase subunit G [Saccharomycopsis crataegensis]